jgi:serine/threonine protein kinase
VQREWKLKENQPFDGRWQIIKGLGQGAYGEVYKARPLPAGDLVALKLLVHDAGYPAKAQESLNKEAAVADLTKSENIVKVTEVVWKVEEKRNYLVMELLEGRNLADLVRDSGRCNPATTVEYLRQAACGLDSSHSVGIIHRDLKPANLFLVELKDQARLSQPIVKILDFGIAKVLAQGADRSIVPLGTPLFMAPEQWEYKQISPATDIWALGLMAFYLLTGRNYWKSDPSDEKLREEVLEKRKVPPSTRIRELRLELELPREFDKWFLRCLRRNPKRRFQKAGTAVKKLSAALGVQNVMCEGTETLGTVPPRPSFLRRKWIVLAAIAVGVIAYAVIALWSGSRTDRDTAPRAGASSSAVGIFSAGGSPSTGGTPGIGGSTGKGGAPAAGGSMGGSPRIGGSRSTSGTPLAGSGGGGPCDKKGVTLPTYCYGREQATDDSSPDTPGRGR